MNTTDSALLGGAFLRAPLGSLPQFTPEDLDEDHKAIGVAARDFVEGEILPRDAAIDALDLDLSRELLRKAGGLGLLGLEVPEAYDGLDLDKISGLLVLEQIGRQASFSVTYGAQTGIGMLPLVYFGSEAQKAKYLPRLASGELVAAYALTEPGAGSDAMNASTTAVLEDGHWVLNGSKMWITNAGFADLFVVFAKVDGRKFSAFLVERGDPGFTIGAEEHKLGIKGSSTRALAFDACRIPADRLLGEVGKGHRIAFGILAIGRFKLGAGCNGLAKEVLKATLAYTAQRKQFGRTVASFGLIRRYLAAMATRIFVAESLNFRTLGAINDGMHAVPWSEPDAAARKMAIMEAFQMEASIMKVWDSEALGRTADEAVQCFGGYGFSTEYPVEKVYRDNRINRIFEGTNEINRLIIAGQVFKKAAAGDLALRRDAGDLPVAGTAEAGDLGEAARAVELAKRQFQFAVAEALEASGSRLIENQEAAALTADMAMAIYAMESAVVRARKMGATGHRWAALARDLAELAVGEGAAQVAGQARSLLAEVHEGAALRQALELLRAFDGALPAAGSRLQGRVAEALVDQGAYPIEAY
ncbi:MAG: acyl-CoA dehydrogenase family protein [Holophagaceae bacterium]